MNRRNFLKRVGQTVAGIAVAPGVISAVETKSMPVANGMDDNWLIDDYWQYVDDYWQYDCGTHKACFWRDFMVFTSPCDDRRICWIHTKLKDNFRDNWFILISEDEFQQWQRTPDYLYWIGKHEIWRLEWCEDIRTFKATLRP